jgi:hypothetical protein
MVIFELRGNYEPWWPGFKSIHEESKPNSFITYRLFDHPTEGLMIARTWGWSDVYSRVDSISEGRRIIKALISGEEMEDIPDNGV